jgi:cytochrome c-type biogenesis protein CcmF
MIPELGQFALVLATVLALLLGVLPLWGTVRPNLALQALARPLALLQFVLVALSFACLAYAFLHNDFSVKYVAEHSNSLLPKPYQFAAKPAPGHGGAGAGRVGLGERGLHVFHSVHLQPI